MSYNEKSLKNLKPMWTSESAKEAQKNSIIARKANKEARERLTVTAAELKLDIESVLKENDISSIGVLKLAMVKAIQSDDFDTAADLAKTLAEFEAPKLARTEATVTEKSADELSDDELHERIQKLMSAD